MAEYLMRKMIEQLICTPQTFCFYLTKYYISHWTKLKSSKLLQLIVDSMTYFCLWRGSCGQSRVWLTTSSCLEQAYMSFCKPILSRSADSENKTQQREFRPVEQLEKCSVVSILIDGQYKVMHSVIFFLRFSRNISISKSKILPFKQRIQKQEKKKITKRTSRKI